ncbi:MAG: response regulator [Oscillospiraceae bacterium]|nr:response regulator [Oscillospiraceae bacterium]
MKKTVFIVDDNETNLFRTREALREYYRVMTLPSAAKLFALLEKVVPDLILLDIKMPDVDGFEVLERLKSNPSYADIPVIFLTNVSEEDVESEGFRLGAVDFITKPFSPSVLFNRVKTHLNIDELIRERTSELEHQNERLRHLQNSILYVVADMVEKRDLATGDHIERTTSYIKILLDAMLEQGVYIEEICDIDFDLFVASARLHDVGKISISDSILNKPGKLTDEEFDIMKTHAQEGELIINKIISRSEGKTFLQYAKIFAGYHHERWDGKGYPHGLSGKDIPLQGRIMALADVYDALVNARPYKKPFSHDEAVEIIVEGKGTQFDPLIVDVFFEVREQFKTVTESNSRVSN